MDTSELYKDFFDTDVVVDVAPPVVYVGRMIEANEYFITLADVDVHDLRVSTVSKEIYIMESRKHGVQPNRKLAKIKQSEVLSLSKLSDIIVY